MQKKIFYALMLLSFLWGMAEMYDYFAFRQEQHSTYRLSQQEKQQVKEGDIILRRGYGLVSDVIALFLNDRYDITHCGIAHQTDSGMYVIHTVVSSNKDGVQLESLDEYVRKSKEGKIMCARLKKQDNARLTKRAAYYLKHNKSFDYWFSIRDTVTFFCSEFAWRLIQDEFQIDIFRLNSDSHQENSMKAFWDTAFFDVFINHQKRGTSFSKQRRED